MLHVASLSPLVRILTGFLTVYIHSMQLFKSTYEIQKMRKTVVVQRFSFPHYSNEVKRNRDRILEINYFIDNQREEWMDMQMGLTEAVDPETAALLGDDF